MLIFFFAYGGKKAATQKKTPVAKNVARPKSRVALSSRRLLHQTAILTQILRQRNSATAN